ncbi:GDSL esterase/lipase At5g03610-like [Aegilops tauschii subsp. strangulata]|uniref:GDSL esterase/lipase n=1 Tax=Aegilops tauschii TaxID=37682 RepID=M8BIS6_AEGTA
MGCTPIFTRPLNYTSCDLLANAGAAQHNAALRSVLGTVEIYCPPPSISSDFWMNLLEHEFNMVSEPRGTLDPNNRTFLLLDVHIPFAAFLLDNDNNDGNVKRFASTLRPCCESFRPDGYCGEEDENGTRQYTLCDDPGRYFYWDDVHLTQAA